MPWVTMTLRHWGVAQLRSEAGGFETRALSLVLLSSRSYCVLCIPALIVLTFVLFVYLNPVHLPSCFQFVVYSWVSLQSSVIPQVCVCFMTAACFLVFCSFEMFADCWITCVKLKPLCELLYKFLTCMPGLKSTICKHFSFEINSVHHMWPHKILTVF